MNCRAHTHTSLAACPGAVFIVLAMALGASPTPGLAAVRANAANVGFQLLEEPVNPVLIGMGSAGTAVPSRGFAYYNPALPALAGRPYVSLEYGGHPAGDLRSPLFETAWPFQKWFIGASAFTAAVDGIISTDWFGRINENAEFSWQTTHLALTVGRIRSNRFAIGVCLNGVQERLAEYVSYGLSASAGAVASPLPGKLTIGLSAFHLGTATSMLDTALDWGEGARFPKSGRLGVAWIDTLKTIGYSAALDIVFRNADKRIMVPAGIEIRPIEQVALRIGKRFNHDTEILNLGAGLDIAPLSGDFSFVIPKLVDDVELKYRVAVTYTLKKKISLGRDRQEVTVPETEALVVTPADTADDSDTADTSAAPGDGSGIVEQEPGDSSQIDSTALEAAPDAAADTAGTPADEPPADTLPEDAQPGPAGPSKGAQAEHNNTPAPLPEDNPGDDAQPLTEPPPAKPESGNSESDTTD
ncbi:MAG: hypothetical protein GF418_12760 [Chitinivibrionales bacterium]|nr:hypothetical protein [Chitinivibrionales bacterium]MBD3396491.1 hypothetical protein [Chitinivibrionales bacterium]